MSRARAEQHCFVLVCVVNSFDSWSIGPERMLCFRKNNWTKLIFNLQPYFLFLQASSPPFCSSYCFCWKDLLKLFPVHVRLISDVKHRSRKCQSAKERGGRGLSGYYSTLEFTLDTHRAEKHHLYFVCQKVSEINVYLKQIKQNCDSNFDILMFK